MKVAIIGSGAGGLYSAILIKKAHPSYEITVFEKEEKIAKKLYATGNGHCNILNKKLSANKFNNPEYIKQILKEFPYQELKKTLNDLGIPLLENEDYLYPLSFHAGSLLKYLITLASSLGVKFMNVTRIKDYQKVDNGYQVDDFGVFDSLIIATGGKSSPNLGSDGSFFGTIAKHGYKLNEIKPGLAPLKVKENVKCLQGVRHHANVKATLDNKQVFFEEGEVLFKKDGLSGIVIFNAESAIYRNKQIKKPKIILDLFPEYSFYSLCDILTKAKLENKECFLSAILPFPLETYLCSLTKGNLDVSSLATNLKHLVFEVVSSYGFPDSQVSIGGVDVNELTHFLESKTERGIYFVGEVLDIDGYCGGCNLSWALMSSLLVSKHI